MSTGSVQNHVPSITVGASSGTASATFPAPVIPENFGVPPASATAAGLAPLPRILVTVGVATATARGGTPFVGPPIAGGVRETTLYLRESWTTLRLRESESDLETRDTSGVLVRSL